MKVLIIGLDGATWDVLDDYLLTYHMPNLKKLKSDGCWGILQSTEPPITPVAWTSLLTGCQPYTHGITGFQEYSFKDNCLRMSSAISCRIPNLWQQLSRQGYKVASINVPWTYPCPEVNGIIAAGYGCPSTRSQFTYPKEFKEELLRKIPDYDFMGTWEWSPGDGFAKFDATISHLERSFRQRLETARLVAKKIDWDAMMVQFHDTDTVHHHIWTYVGKDSRDKHTQQRDRLFKMYETLDKTIGELLDCVSGTEALVIVASDHGGGRAIGAIKPNILLHKWGYLKQKPFWARMGNHALQQLRSKFRSLPFFQSKVDSKNIKQPWQFNLDWQRSKAMVIHATVDRCYVYLNVKGRQRSGCVEPGSQYNAVIAELRKLFGQVRNPVTGERLFRRVVTAAELYGISNADPEQFGDLVLISQPGYGLKTSRSLKGDYLKTEPEDSLAGTHYREGIYLFSGKNVQVGHAEQTDIVNIAPTVYAALGAKLPTYLDGKVLNKAFVENLKVEYSKGESPPGLKTATQQELSLEEEMAISERLSELGYLDTQ